MTKTVTACHYSYNRNQIKSELSVQIFWKRDRQKNSWLKMLKISLEMQQHCKLFHPQKLTLQPKCVTLKLVDSLCVKIPPRKIPSENKNIKKKLQTKAEGSVAADGDIIKYSKSQVPRTKHEEKKYFITFSKTSTTCCFNEIIPSLWNSLSVAAEPLCLWNNTIKFFKCSYNVRRSEKKKLTWIDKILSRRFDSFSI